MFNAWNQTVGGNKQAYCLALLLHGMGKKDTIWCEERDSQPSEPRTTVHGIIFSHQAPLILYPSIYINTHWLVRILSHRIQNGNILPSSAPWLKIRLIQAPWLCVNMVSDIGYKVFLSNCLLFNEDSQNFFLNLCMDDKCNLNDTEGWISWHDAGK